MPVTHEVKPVPPGCKRVDVTLVIHTYEDVPEDWGESDVRFFIEDNHCLGNYLAQIRNDEQEAKNRAGIPAESGIEICQLCSFAEAYVGHLPFPKKAEREMETR